MKACSQSVTGIPSPTPRSRVVVFEVADAAGPGAGAGAGSGGSTLSGVPVSRTGSGWGSGIGAGVGFFLTGFFTGGFNGADFVAPLVPDPARLRADAEGLALPDPRRADRACRSG